MLIVDSQIHIWAQGAPNPAHRQVSSYGAEELPWLKGRNLELVMGRALCDWIGWKL